MNYVLIIMFRFREVSLTEFCMVHNWWMEYPGGSSLWWGPCCLCSGGSSLCRGCYWLYQGGSSLHRGWYWLYQWETFWFCSGGSFYDEALADSTLDEVCVKVVFCNWKEVALMTKFFLVEAFIQVLDLKLDKLCFMFKFQDILWKEFFRRWFMDYAQDRVLFLK